MKKLILLCSLLATLARAENTVPKDSNNVPIYSGTGKSVFSEAVTLTTSSFALLLTLPTTGESYVRSWKHIVVRNPDATRSVYICLGGSSSCSTSHLKIPPLLGLALDDLYFGPLNSITTIWGKLDSSGSVIPEITVW